jgi:hypothetical protein
VDDTEPYMKERELARLATMLTDRVTAREELMQCPSVKHLKELDACGVYFDFTARSGIKHISTVTSPNTILLNMVILPINPI